MKANLYASEKLKKKYEHDSWDNRTNGTFLSNYFDSNHRIEKVYTLI